MSTEQPESSHDVFAEESLADTDESQEERGRIGYGRNERTSSWMLGAVLILLVIAIAIFQWMGSRNDESGSKVNSVDSPIVGAQAPDFTLRTFAGEDITLSNQRGKVVIVNFWGSWCEPCIREMPAFQAYWETAPDDVMMIGVGAKQDSVEKSQAFADRFEVSYPIGRDDGGDRVTTGLIAQEYQISFYPMTYIISPDGVISSLVVGEMDEDALDTYVKKARDDSAARLPSPLAINHRRIQI